MGAHTIDIELNIDIYNYHDYRTYLAKALALGKSQYNLSLREIARIAGISHGYLPLVLKGKRNLNKKTTLKLNQFLNLSESELSYLVSLTALSDGRSAEVREQALKQIQRSKSFKTKHAKEFETVKYLNNWHYVAIRELAQTKGFKNDIQWIRKQLPAPIRSHEIESALNFLLENGFLLKQSDGSLVPAEKGIRCSGGVFGITLGSFHKKMLDLAKEAIAKFPRQRRKQIGYTTAIPKSQFEKVQNILEEAQRKIKDLELEQSDNADTVYHINLSAFPLAGKGCFDDE